MSVSSFALYLLTLLLSAVAVFVFLLIAHATAAPVLGNMALTVSYSNAGGSITAGGKPSVHVLAVSFIHVLAEFIGKR